MWWSDARTLADVGELTAQWLTGELGFHPGNYGGPDDETASIADVLAAANRAGFVTLTSQPGETGPVLGYSPAYPVLYEQRAYVVGLADGELAGRLIERAVDAGLFVIDYPPPAPRGRCDTTRAVVDGRRMHEQHRDGPYGFITTIGTQASRAGLRFEFRECPRSARKALYAAHQITLVDPAWGPSNRLWDVLAAEAVR